MIKRLKLVILLFFILTDILSAQVQDAGAWISLNFEKKITRALAFNLSEELRINENMTELGTIFSDAGISYKFKDLFKLSGNYRFINKKRLDNSYSIRHRYYFDLSFKKKIKPVDVLLRLRFQSQYKDMLSSTDGMIPENYLRTKLTVKIKFKKAFVPYLYSELFNPLNKPDQRNIDNMRYCAGLEYKINRRYMLDFFYLIQVEQNVKNPQTDFIAGMGLYSTF
jgi:hypothetical protein